MSLTIRARQDIVRELFDMVQDYVTEEMIIKPEEFNKRFRLTIGHANCRGGLSKGSPIMTLSVNNRYFDKTAYLDELATKTHMATSGDTVWRKAHLHALKGKWYHTEYSRIHMDPEIGAFVSNNPEDHVLATVCHEFAHVVAYWRMYTEHLSRPMPHGAKWRSYYRELRNEFHNSWLVR